MSIDDAKILPTERSRGRPSINKEEGQPQEYHQDASRFELDALEGDALEKYHDCA